MVKDPVCKMMIDEKRAVTSVSFRGKLFHFCSAGCKAKFDADPARYHAEASKPS